MKTTSKLLAGLLISFATIAGAQPAPSADAPATPSTEAQAAPAAEAIPKVAESTIVPGYYHDDSKEGGHDLYIKAVGNGPYKTYYAVIVWKANFISVYRLEEVDASTQAWVQLFQGADNMLTTEKEHTATYAVTQVRDGHSLGLRFSWTAYAKTLGPNVLCSIEPVFTYKGQQKQWTQFSQLQHSTLKGNRVRKQVAKDPLKRKLEMIISDAGQDGQWNVLANNLILETVNTTNFVNKGAGGREQGATQYIYNGEFRAEEIVPGLIVVRKKDLDSTSASGISINREISFMAASFGNSIQAFTMPPKARDCAYNRTELK